MSLKFNVTKKNKKQEEKQNMKCHLPTGREGYFKWGKSFAKSGTGGGLGPDPGGPGGLRAPLWEKKRKY